MKVIITIPAFNEEKTLGPVLKEISGVMDKTKYSYMILVLNDGSQDKTIQVAKKGGARVVSNKRNLGLAETFKKEMEESATRLKDEAVSLGEETRALLEKELRSSLT